MTHEQAQKAQEIQGELRELMSFRNAIAVEPDHSASVPNIEEFEFKKVDIARTLVRYEYMDKTVIDFKKINFEVETAIKNRWDELQKQLEKI